jgi:hypothetical protein
MYKVAQFSIFYPSSFSTFLCDILALEALILTLMPKHQGLLFLSELKSSGSIILMISAVSILESLQWNLSS